MVMTNYESGLFQALASPVRRAMIDALADGERNVNALVERLDVTQSAVSQQLLVLKTAGLVEERKEGRFRYYRLRAEPLAELEEWTQRYRAALGRQLDALGEVLDTMEDE